MPPTGAMKAAKLDPVAKRLRKRNIEGCWGRTWFILFPWGTRRNIIEHEMLELGLDGQIDVFQMENQKRTSQVDNDMCGS